MKTGWKIDILAEKSRREFINGGPKVRGGIKEVGDDAGRSLWV